jgi:hypothetical protein
MIETPQGFIRTKRTGHDGVERIVFIGYVAEAIPEGDEVRLEVHAPEKLITDRPEPPFPPPMSEVVTAPKIFEFWWKQLDYVFGLADPRTFPPLHGGLSTDEDRIVRRYISVATELARSGVLNSHDGFGVQVSGGLAAPWEVEKWFSRTDLQVGFAGLVRQCDSPRERARFERVRGILWVAAEAASDPAHEHGLTS